MPVNETRGFRVPGTARVCWPVLAAVAAGFAFACGRTSAFGQETTPTEKSIPDLPHKDFRDAEPCPVVRVCRGDTVIVKMGAEAKRIGLIGVEVAGLGEPAGSAAERFLENLLAGERVFVEFVDSNPVADRFGCIPAYLYRAPDGLFVNLELVRQGYAGVPEASVFEHRPIFEYFQQRAREVGKGRWAPNQTPDGPGPRRSVQPSTRAAGTASKATRRGRHLPASRPRTVTGEAAPAAAAPQVASGDGEAGEDTIVYVTAKGAKYHREGCRYVRKGGRPITLGEARRLGLTPCSQCKPPD